MNKPGKELATKLIKDLVPSGSTNLWDGLRVALNEVK